MRISKRFTTQAILLAVMTVCMGTALSAQGNQESRVMPEPRVYAISTILMKRLTATGAMLDSPAYWALGKKHS